MTDDRDVLETVRAALHSEARVHPTDRPIHLVFANGDLPREAERKLAEDDAWYVFGVDRVINRIVVQT